MRGRGFDLADTPPYANRGVQSTDRPTLRACVDWVQVTFPNAHDVQQISQILRLPDEDFRESSTGGLGYRRKRRLGHIAMYSDGQPGMGIHVEMSGQGCREYENMDSALNWRDFVRTCFEHEAKFSRMDAAIDEIRYNDDKPYFRVSTLFRKVRDGCVESRFKKGKRVESFLVNDGTSLGETLYFGREQSDLQIRFYEKDLERLNAGKELEDGISCWNRSELQCRRDRAQALALHLLNTDDFGKVVAGVLKNNINFLVRNPGDSNRRRWKTCKWWDDFLGDVEPLKLTFIAPDKTIERSRSWIDKQVSPTLGMLFYAAEGDMDLIVDILNDGMDRLTDQQVQMADEYKRKVAEIRKEREYQRWHEYQKMMFRTTNTHRKSPSSSSEE